MSSGEPDRETAKAVHPALAWARDRLGWESIAHLAAKKEVPIHRHAIFYYLGGMALFLFLVQVATGILLLLYYRPSAAEAFESVQYIMAEVPFGWLIRSIHSWGANLFVGVVFLHLISVFFGKAYRAPREMTWISGRDPALPDLRLRLLRLPPAVEHAVLLRDEGRHRRSGADPGRGLAALAHPEGRLGCDRRRPSRASTASTSPSFRRSRR